jgi:hypothetical protein
MKPDHRSIHPGYLSKLNEAQRTFILTAAGRKFYWEFIRRFGNHLYIVGNTGSGKTQKGYWAVNWLRHTENIIWISTGKSNEILPLLSMGMKVRIIVPGDSEFKIEEYTGNAWVERKDGLEVTRVESPEAALRAIKGPERDDGGHYQYTTINILEFRKTLSPKLLGWWMSELFSILTEWAVVGDLPNNIFPASIFIDESQWVLAGTRITTDQSRTKSSEIITESALELRSSGGRLVFFAQDFKNINPAIRENMLCGILCRGAEIDKSDNGRFYRWCMRPGIRWTTTFKQNEGRFVFDDGDSTINPWGFPLFPLLDYDRMAIDTMRVKYGQKYQGKIKTQDDIIQEECLPELGRFSAMAIPPEKQGEIISRWNAEGVTSDD